jgi:hypothetical protein
MLGVPHQPQDRFVHQRGCLQRVARGLRCHSMCGEAPQFLIHHWQQLFGGLRIALFDGVKQKGVVVHDRGGE